MPRFKDWRLGEFRIRIEIVASDGSKMQAYIPGVEHALGQEFIDLTLRAANSKKTETSNA
jgi:hypothetical protein